MMAEQLCEVANQQQVIITSEVRGAYNNEIMNGLPTEIQIQSVSLNDESFIIRLIEISDSILNDPTFDVGAFGKKVGFSRSQLYRKVSSITGLSPNDFIREFRLKKALDLIENHKCNVTQIAFGAGFNSPSYFSKCFQKQYGILPSNMVKMRQPKKTC